MDGGLLVAKTLAAQGVTTVFTLCGGHIAPILVHCEQQGIRVIDTRHEVTAVFAADAVARLTGIPGVAVVTAGPGVTNTITAVKNAQMAQSPLVLLGGATATILKGRGSLQDIDQMSLIKPHVKWATSIRHVRDIPSILREAFYRALSGVPGPVFVEIPLDTLFPETLVREWYGIKSVSGTSQSLRDRALQWYVSRHLKLLFAGAEQTQTDNPPIAPDVQEVSESKISAVGKCLRHAARPVMLIGSQALVDPRRVHELVRAVEQIGIPVYLSGMARGLFGKNHPLQVRHNRKEALREADVVLLAGVPCDFRLDYGNHINKKATLVTINRSKAEGVKNRKPQYALHGDPLRCLLRLAAFCEPQSVHTTEFHQILSARDKQRNADIASQSFLSVGEERLNPLFVCQTLEEQLTSNSVIVADGGDFVATASYILQPPAPLSWYDPGVFGTLGVGAGFALGIKAIRPDAEVWIVYGDGSLGYSLVEFDTFVRHGMGVVAVVGNDAGWTQIARDQIPLLGAATATTLALTAYHEAVRALGGDGVCVRHNHEVETAFLNASESARKNIPFLVNCIIGATDFRKGSLSM